MQIEDISWVSFTARWAAQQQGHLTVGHGLLGQIIIHDQRGVSCVAEELPNGSSREGRIKLQRGRIRCRCRHHHGIRHGTRLFQGLNNASYRRSFLADGDINTEHRFAGVIEFLLVDDGVHRHRRLSGLTVADDQLTLAATNRNHRVHSLDACLQRLVHRLTENHTWGLALHGHLIEVALDVSLAVNGLTQSVDHPAQHAPAHLHRGDAVQALH